MPKLVGTRRKKKKLVGTRSTKKIVGTMRKKKKIVELAAGEKFEYLVYKNNDFLNENDILNARLSKFSRLRRALVLEKYCLITAVSAVP